VTAHFHDQDELHVLIIGLGNVAIGYDLQANGNRRKTHLFSMNDILSEKGVHACFYGVDPDINAQLIALQSFPTINVFSSLLDLPEIRFDLVIISVPISESYAVTHLVIDRLHFRVLCLEKPGASSVKQANDLNMLFLKLPEVYILYSRRALPSSSTLRNIYADEFMGDYQIEITYSGSSLNILSHFIDLLEFIFGVETSMGSLSFKDMRVLQTSEQNMNDHRIKILGPICLDYSFGGKEILLVGTDGNQIEFNSAEEISSQIWYTAHHYLSYFFDNMDMGFPRKISDSILDIMEGE